MIEVIILNMLFGSTFALSKLLLIYTTPLFAVGLRMSLGGTLLLGYVYYTYRTLPLKKSDIWLYAQLALFNIALPYSLRLWSMESISSIKAALLFNFAPLLTALFAYFMHKARLNTQQIIGLLLGCCSIIPVVLTHTGSETALFTVISWAEAASLIATVCISYSLIVTQKLVKERQCPAALANGISMFAGGILTLVAGLGIEEPLIKGSMTGLIGFVLLQTVIINLICFSWRAQLLTKYNPTFLACASLIAPISATFYGWLIFGEKVSWAFIASFVIVIVGLALYYTGQKKMEIKA